MTRQISKQEFEMMPPYERGYTVYMLGAREDQPYVPDEQNPYPVHSGKAREWDRGAAVAVQQTADMEE